MDALAEMEAAASELTRELIQEPESPQTGESVMTFVQQLNDLLDSANFSMVRRLTPAQRAQFAEHSAQPFQRLADSLRRQLQVALQLEDRHAIAVPWRRPLSLAVERLEREVAQLGLILQPTRPLPEVIRQPTTGRLVVVEHPSLGAAAALERLAASLRSEGRTGGLGAGGLAENAPVLVGQMRQIIATVAPERLEHLDWAGIDAVIGVVRDTQRYLRNFLDLCRQLGHEDEAWFRELSGLLREFEHIRERIEFFRQLPKLGEVHVGQYVAMHDGEVVDADRSRRALVRRFFDRFGDASVYIGFVGGQPPPARVPTPFVRHSP